MLPIISQTDVISCLRQYPVKTLYTLWHNFFHPKSTDIFLISVQKHTLWVLIRSATVMHVLLMSTHNMFLCRNKKNDMSISPLIWSYAYCSRYKGVFRRFFFVNPYPAEFIKMPRPLLIFSQSDHLIQIVDINSHT